MSTPALTFRARALWLLTMGTVLSNACVPLSEPEEDATPGFRLPTVDGDTSNAREGETAEPTSVGLCEFPEEPPRAVAVGSGEQVCGTGDEVWPDCLPQQCAGDTFAEACRRHCEMTCERERWFCTRNHCPPPGDGSPGQSYCDSEEAMAECDDLCHGDLECLVKRCETTRDARCEEITCPPGEASRCQGLDCSNECATARDGLCDDGSPLNSHFSSCSLGSDCSDCGPREACFELGAECFGDSQCCGYATNQTHCVNLGTADAPLGRCTLDCTDAPLACPAGFTCQPLRGNGAEGPAACVPNCATLGDAGLAGSP